jgi:hypothetical protein
LSEQQASKSSIDTSHHFIDGHSSRLGLLGIVAFPNRLRGTDTESTTLYFTLDDDWSHETFGFDGRSLTYLGAQGTGDWWPLGKRGEVARLGDEIVVEQVPTAGTGPNSYGYLNAIRNIGGALYVCGYRRQVLSRGRTGWFPVDADIRENLTSEGSSLESIDGVDGSCIYAVGSGGQIWYYNGNTWRRCSSPTNADLHEVRCLSPNDVAIVGQHGTVLVGSMDSWRVYEHEEFDEDLWGVEYFDDSIFVSGLSGIGRIGKNGLEVVDTGLDKKVFGYRLRARDGVLWSIGNDHILSFDGRKWSEHPCPDNK